MFVNVPDPFASVDPLSVEQWRPAPLAPARRPRRLPLRFDRLDDGDHAIRNLPGFNLFLAGDWTATGSPATMEGAVRSGNLAAAAIVKAEMA